jgi:pyruvate formate lyase activating enzyme
VGEKIIPFGCNLEAQGATSCGVRIPQPDGYLARPCELGYRFGANDTEPNARLIFSVFLRIPEDYLGVEQSICNHACQFCHSHFFTQHSRGMFYTIDQLVAGVLNYAFRVTVIEPRERATFFHSGDLCRHGGSCVLHGIRSPTCPGILAREQVLISPMGFGPARNIASFTGGDLLCRPRFLARVTRQIRDTLTGIKNTHDEILNIIRQDPAWDERRATLFEDLSRLKKPETFYHLVETNGFGCTNLNLDILKNEGSIDTMCVTVKAADPKIYRQLAGTTAGDLEQCVYAITGAKHRGFLTEAATILIPKWVEADQIGIIARRIAESAGSDVPFTIIAFRPSCQMNAPQHPDAKPPTQAEMLAAFEHASDYLDQVKIANTSLFTTSEDDKGRLEAIVGRRLV